MTGSVALEARSVSKSYGAVSALTDVSVEFRRGEVTALLGDNGAGKSTLIKVLSGVVRPDTGAILVHGVEHSFNTPHDAITAGVETVYQDLALAPALDIADNVYLGREVMRSGPLGWLGVINRRLMRQKVTEELKDLRINIGSVASSPVEDMSGGQRQAVAIARSVMWSQDILILDEPTAALGMRESDAVLELIESVRARGLTVIIVSHALPHIMRVADRAVVMRHGRVVADIERENLDAEHLVGLIVGSR